MIRIGIQGEQGSFSEEAAGVFIQAAQLTSTQLDYLTNSENVLNAVSNKLVDYGIIAIENSTYGIVLETIYAMAKYQFNIVDIFSINVLQNLLVLPNTTFDSITRIHSHRQALGQCQHYLAKHFPHCQLTQETDTADAARRLSQGELAKTAAVIANKACAKIYSLDILAANIQDTKDNKTVFLAVSTYE